MKGKNTDKWLKGRRGAVTVSGNDYLNNPQATETLQRTAEFDPKQDRVKEAQELQQALLFLQKYGSGINKKIIVNVKEM